jgi:hypothetical protein
MAGWFEAFANFAKAGAQGLDRYQQLRQLDQENQLKIRQQQLAEQQQQMQQQQMQKQLQLLDASLLRQQQQDFTSLRMPGEETSPQDMQRAQELQLGGLFTPGATVNPMEFAGTGPVVMPQAQQVSFQPPAAPGGLPQQQVSQGPALLGNMPHFTGPSDPVSDNVYKGTPQQRMAQQAAQLEQYKVTAPDRQRQLLMNALQKMGVTDPRVVMETLNPQGDYDFDDSASSVFGSSQPGKYAELLMTNPNAAATFKTAVEALRPPRSGGASGRSATGIPELAAMAAQSPGVLGGLTPTDSGLVMRELATNPELRAKYEDTRMSSLRQRSQLILSAVDKLIVPDTLGQYQLAPGAKSIFGEMTPVWARDYNLDPASVDANAALKQVLGQQIVDLIADMKAQSRTGATGFGQLNIRELDVLQSAATQLTNRLSEPAALRELVTLKEKLEKILAPTGSPQTANPANTARPTNIRRVPQPDGSIKIEIVP